MDGRKVGFSREGILKTRVERGGAAKRFGKGKLPVVSEFCLSFALFKRCEREQSHTNTVARYGTHGGPPGRMTLVQ